MNQTLKKTLYTFFFKQYPNWVASGELERMVFKNRNGTTAKPSSVSRALRMLEEKRNIAVKYEGAVASATYKYLPKDLRSNYIPIALRPAHKRNVMFKVPLQEIANSKLPLDPEQEKYWDSLK